MMMNTSGYGSIFIPHVFDYITLSDLAQILQTTKGGIGHVFKIESIPKQNETDGHHYYSAFVYFDYFYSTYYGNEIYNTLFLKNEQCKLYLENRYLKENTYIILCPNTSVVSIFAEPVHMDLTLSIHTDFSKDTIERMMEALDFGKVHHIEWGEASVECANTEGTVWPLVNPAAMEKALPDFASRIVTVRMEYWYKTQIAIYIQNQIAMQGVANVPIGNGITFVLYETEPMLEGVNPFVWYNNGSSRM